MPANVTSIDAIRALRTALLKFESQSRDGVTMLVLEARRAMDWLDNDRRRYWPEQVKRASQRVLQARSDLERCELKYGSEDAPSCYEQKKALERAKRRLRTCEEKVKAVKRWIRAVRQELNEFDGQIARMNNCLETDLPRSVAALEQMLRALDKYAGSHMATDSAGTAAAASGDGEPAPRATTAEQREAESP